MRIGVDLSGFVFGKAPGFNEYALALVEGLDAVVPEESCVTLFVRPGQGIRFNVRNPRVVVSESVLACGEIGRLIWHHFYPWSARHDFDAFLFPSNFAPILLPCRSVVVVHDLNFLVNPRSFTWTQRLYRRMFSRWSIRRAAGVIAISSASAEEVQTFGGRRPAVIHNAVRALPVAQYSKGHHLLCASSLAPYKNVAAAAAACIRLLDEDDQLSATFIGNWAPRDFPSGCRHPRLRALGFVDDVTRSRLIAESQVILAPSKYEGFGMPYVEALMAGAALVCCDLPIAREVIGNAAYWIPSPYGAEEILMTLRAARAENYATDPLSSKIVQRYRPAAVASKYLSCIQAIVRGTPRMP